MLNENWHVFKWYVEINDEQIDSFLFNFVSTPEHEEFVAPFEKLQETGILVGRLQVTMCYISGVMVAYFTKNTKRSYPLKSVQKTMYHPSGVERVKQNG